MRGTIPCPLHDYRLIILKSLDKCRKAYIEQGLNLRDIDIIKDLIAAMHHRTNLCFKYLKNTANNLCISIRTVSRTMSKLRALGFVQYGTRKKNTCAKIWDGLYDFASLALREAITKKPFLKYFREVKEILFTDPFDISKEKMDSSIFGANLKSSNIDLDSDNIDLKSSNIDLDSDNIDFKSSNIDLDSDEWRATVDIHGVPLSENNIISTCNNEENSKCLESEIFLPREQQKRSNQAEKHTHHNIGKTCQDSSIGTNYQDSGIVRQLFLDHFPRRLGSPSKNNCLNRGAKTPPGTRFKDFSLFNFYLRDRIGVNILRGGGFLNKNNELGDILNVILNNDELSNLDKNSITSSKFDEFKEFDESDKVSISSVHTENSRHLVDINSNFNNYKNKDRYNDSVKIFSEGDFDRYRAKISSNKDAFEWPF